MTRRYLWPLVAEAAMVKSDSCLDAETSAVRRFASSTDWRGDCYSTHYFTSHRLVEALFLFEERCFVSFRFVELSIFARFWLQSSICTLLARSGRSPQALDNLEFFVTYWYAYFPTSAPTFRCARRASLEYISNLDLISTLLVLFCSAMDFLPGSTKSIELRRLHYRAVSRLSHIFVVVQFLSVRKQKCDSAAR